MRNMDEYYVIIDDNNCYDGKKDLWEADNREKTDQNYISRASPKEVIFPD